MTKFHHGKYIVTEPKEKIVVPEWGGSLSAERSTRVMYLDSEVIKGAFYVEVVWFWPTDQKDTSSPAPHAHKYDEVLAFFGTDRKNLNDLGAEIELWIDNEQNIMNQSFLAFIPAGRGRVTRSFPLSCWSETKHLDEERRILCPIPTRFFVGLRPPPE
jgi:hypothetical protein